MIFVDTNYWLRYLTDQESEQGKIALQLFLDAARGKADLCSSTVVFFEIYWVMKSVYKTNQADLQKLLNNLLKMDCVDWHQNEILIEAVSVMENFGYDLEDSFNVCFALHKKVDELASFDQKLQKKWKKITQNL